jgi:5-carboxymethyl-2-hydroxymuconate isomerase
MPHITVEYCETLSAVDIPKLVAALHEDLSTRETINLHGIKSRAVPVKYVIVGDQTDYDKMIHITLKLLPGRSDDLRKEMAQGLAAAARQHASDTRIAITCEVVELDAASYIK